MKNFRKTLNAEKYLYLMILPLLLYYIIFRYIPMFGVYFAFTDFLPGRIFTSKWVGLRWFQDFFNSIYFSRIVLNTVILSSLTLVFSFPVPIIFALLLNEVWIKHMGFKRIVQTISYLPHFISVVVIVGMLVNFFSPDGIVNIILGKLGFEFINFMARPEWFRPLYVGSQIWSSFGWDSIIYIAAITAIDPQLYESAAIDGANRWQMTWRITIPGISTTIIILLILNMGRLMSVGFEKIILMYNPSIYATADVISTFVYRRGIVEGRYAFGIAVDLFNSAINFILVFTANYLSKKVSSVSLW